jgi:hypothetical protein
MDYRSAGRNHQLRAWLSAVLRVSPTSVADGSSLRWCTTRSSANCSSRRVAATRGNRRPIHVSATPSLDRALLATTFPYDQRVRCSNAGGELFNIVPGEPLYAPLVYPVVDHTARWDDRQLGLFCKITPD